MENQLIIIDGSSMLVTAYYGNLPKALLFEKDPEKKKELYSQIMKNEHGRYTNALYVMCRTLDKIMAEQKPSHIAIVFDTTRDTFRREIYPEYKGNRGETPEPLKEQFISAEKMLHEMGYPVFFSTEYEADDLAGSLAKRFESEIPVRIITKDHDYLQLVTDNTLLWLLQKDQDTATKLMRKYESPCDEEDFKELMASIPAKAFEVTKEKCLSEYGCRPEQVPDLKGIVGDASDNIPGIKGVSSAASPLLAEYGTLEAIMDKISSCKEKAAETQLNAFWKDFLGIKRSPLNAFHKFGEIGLLSKKLATIKTDINVVDSLEKLKANINNKERARLYTEYGFKSLL